MPTCPGCLGTGQCWICDGAGCTPSGQAGSNRCRGDGVCRLCARRMPQQRDSGGSALIRP